MIPVHHAAILAGGASSRMGREKALIPWRGESLITHVAATLRPIFPHICVVTSRIEVADAAKLPSIADHFTARGPLGGLHAALSHFAAPTFLVACDMPFLSAPLIEWMSFNFKGRALVPEGEFGPEPLHAIYDASCLPLLEHYGRGAGKVPSLRQVCAEMGGRIVPLAKVREFSPDLKCFSNWNTPTDLETGDAASAT